MRNSKHGLDYQKMLGVDKYDVYPNQIDKVLMTNMSRKPMFYYDGNGNEVIVEQNLGPYVPEWQTSPILKNEKINKDWRKQPQFAHKVQTLIDTQVAVIGGFEISTPGFINSTDEETVFIVTVRSMAENREVYYSGSPIARIFLPVYDSFGIDRKPVAVLMSIIHWRSNFNDILPENVNGIVAVFHSTCDSGVTNHVTFDIDGSTSKTRALGDDHDRNFESYGQSSDMDISSRISDRTVNGTSIDFQIGCRYGVDVYPSEVGASTNNLW
jgi:hypothetical protein